MFYAMMEVFRGTRRMGYYLFEWGTHKSTFWELSRVNEFCQSLGAYAVQNMHYDGEKLIPLWQTEESFPKLFLNEEGQIRERKQGPVVLGFELGTNSYKNYKSPDSWFVECAHDSKIKRYSLNEVARRGIREVQSVFIGDKPINGMIASRIEKLQEDDALQINGTEITENLSNLGVSQITLKKLTDKVVQVGFERYTHLLNKVSIADDAYLDGLELGGFIRYIGNNALDGLNINYLGISGDCTKYELQTMLNTHAKVVDLRSSSGLLTDMRFESKFNFGTDLEDLYLPNTVKGIPTALNEDSKLRNLYLGEITPGQITIELANFRHLNAIYVTNTGGELDMLRQIICSQLGKEILVVTRKDDLLCKVKNYSWF